MPFERDREGSYRPRPNLPGKTINTAIPPDNQPATVAVSEGGVCQTDTQVSFTYEPDLRDHEFRVRRRSKKAATPRSLSPSVSFFDSAKSQTLTYAGPRGQMKVIQGTTHNPPLRVCCPPSAGNQHSELRTLLTADFEQIQHGSAV